MGNDHNRTTTTTTQATAITMRLYRITKTIVWLRFPSTASSHENAITLCMAENPMVAQVFSFWCLRHNVFFFIFVALRLAKSIDGSIRFDLPLCDDGRTHAGVHAHNRVHALDSRSSGRNRHLSSKRKARHDRNETKRNELFEWRYHFAWPISGIESETEFTQIECEKNALNTNPNKIVYCWVECLSLCRGRIVRAAILRRVNNTISQSYVFHFFCVSFRFRQPHNSFYEWSSFILFVCPMERCHLCIHYF